MTELSPLYSKEKIKRIVDEVMAQKNDNPRDSTFRFLQSYYGEAQHESLRYPGKFLKSLGTEVFTPDNRNRKMDGAEMVMPDDTIPVKSTLNAEQQTTIVTPDKKDSLYDYKLELVFKYKMPCLNVILTNIGDKDHTVIYESHGDAFKVHVRVFNDEEIYKRLNTLSYNIEHKKILSLIEVLDFAYILLFAQENKAKEYSKKVVKLFGEVKFMDKRLQADIYHVLKKLIRLHFRDDELKTRELLAMITESVHPEAIKMESTYDKMSERIDNLGDVIIQKDDALSKKDEKISLMDMELSQIKEESSHKDERISLMGMELSQIKEESLKNKEELIKLKSILKEHNIEVD